MTERHGADDRELERLRRALADRDREIAELRRLLAEQGKQIADLQRRLALREQNSTTTSKPPSSDGLAGRPRVRGRRATSRRPRGGQLGHPGHWRAPVPAERVDAVIALAPPTCHRCQHALTPADDLGEPQRHQVTELPPIEAHVTEYQCQRRRCPACGGTTRVSLPDEIVGHQFGPQLTALIAYLTVGCRMPRLVVQRFLAGVLQIPISLGSTHAAWDETSVAVASVYRELETAVAAEPVLNVDETGHRTNAMKRWLWAFVARTFVVYRITASRGADVLTTVLGEHFGGILGSDRLPTYLKYVVAQRQLCWAHFTRNLLSALELASTPSAKRFCREALVHTRRLFRLWHRFGGDPTIRGGPITRDELIAKARPIAGALYRLSERHLEAANKEVRNLAAAMCRHHDHFFTFLFEDGVEPTNNAAERALRTAVQWRKTSFGTRSEEGERAVERLLTVVRTCQLQQLNALVYLTAAVAAHRRRQQVASLLHRTQAG